MARIHQVPRIDGASGWYKTAPDHNAKLGDPLIGEKEFDFVIIGAGFIGLSLAHRLAERLPDVTIAILDALKVGQGTSGRNAGFIIDVPHNVDGGKTEPEHDRKLFKLNNFAIQHLSDFKDRFSI